MGISANTSEARASILALLLMQRGSRQKQFVQLVEEGLAHSLIEAATILGLSRQTIYKYSEQTGIALKGRTGVPSGWRSLRTKQATEDLRRLVDEGKVSSKAEAALVLGVSVYLVNQILLDAGLAIRPRKSAPPTCNRCGCCFKTRSMRDDGLCGRCRGAKVEVVCPSCGARREVCPSARGALKTGLCRSCYRKEISQRAAEHATMA